MNFLAIMGGFFKKAFSKEYLTFTLIAIIGILVFTTLNYRGKYRSEVGLREQQKVIYEQNLFALNDTIRKTINKEMGAYEFDKGAFLTSIENLAKYDEALARQLNGMKGELLSAIDGLAEVELPPADVDGKLIDYADGDNRGDGEYGLAWNFNYADSGLVQKLSGQSRFKLFNNTLYPGITTIDTNRFKLNLTYGFKEEDDRYKVWAVSRSPYVNISELTGAYFIDKPPPVVNTTMGQRPFSIGPQIGYGVNFDNKLQNIRTGWHFGIGIQYNIINFGKRKVKSQKASEKGYEKAIDNILGTNDNPIDYNSLKEHTVSESETIYSISNRYGMTTNQLKKLNNIDSENLEVGQVLLVSNNY